jgi:hypothetical protein
MFPECSLTCGVMGLQVGYQCSAVYRQVIIPAGLLRDPNFKISASGVAIWAPTKNT